MSVRARTLYPPVRTLTTTVIPLRWPALGVASVLDYYLDVGAEIAATGDSIASFTAVASGLTCQAMPYTAGTALGVTLSGGTPDTDYGVRWAVTTRAGRVLTYDVFVACVPFGVESLYPSVALGASGPPGTPGGRGDSGAGLPAGMAGQVLVTDGTGSPAWVDPTAIDPVVDGGWFS